MGGILSAVGAVVFTEATMLFIILLFVLSGWNKLWSPLAFTFAFWYWYNVPWQLSGAGARLSNGDLIVAWLRSPGFHYRFPLALISRAELVDRADLTGHIETTGRAELAARGGLGVRPEGGVGKTICRWSAETGTLVLVRGRGPAVALDLAAPYRVTFRQQDHLRVFGNPKPVAAGVRRVVFTVDDARALYERLKEALDPGREGTPVAIPGERVAPPTSEAPVPAGAARTAPAAPPRTASGGHPSPGEPAAPGGLPAAEVLLVADGLRYAYGDIQAVAGVGFSVGAGEVVGLVGLNGAGKTTTLRLLTGILRPQRGQVSVSGHDLWAGERSGAAARRQVGFVPSSFPVYPRLSGRAYLDFVARLYSVPLPLARERAAALAGRLALPAAVLDRPAGSYSTGTRQKLLIVASVVHDPRFLVMDEPASGLDPEAQFNFKKWLGERARSGTGILLSSHSLELVSDCCTSVLIMHEGIIVARGSLRELAQRFGVSSDDPEAIFFAAIGRRSR